MRISRHGSYQGITRFDIVSVSYNLSPLVDGTKPRQSFIFIQCLAELTSTCVGIVAMNDPCTFTVQFPLVDGNLDSHCS